MFLPPAPTLHQRWQHKRSGIVATVIATGYHVKARNEYGVVDLWDPITFVTEWEQVG